MRLAVCALTLLVLVMTIVSHPVRRYRANLERERVERLVQRAEQTAGFERRRLALEAVERANYWLAFDPADYRMLVFRGAAEAVLGMKERAIATYTESLYYNERPEVHAYIGLLYLELGAVDRGISSLVRAARFNASTTGFAATPTRKRIADELARQRRQRPQIESSER